jgi:signal transduction histidine kinase
MTHRQPVVIDDIYADDRIPHDAYRPTFVRSLAMVPIRRTEPIGAIGNYWRSSHRARPEEVELLQALADATAVAMENVGLWSDVETRMAARTADLDAALTVNERLLGTMAHELRNSVGACHGLLELVLSAGTLPDGVREDLRVAYSSAGDALRILREQLALAKLRGGQPSPRVTPSPTR